MTIQTWKRTKNLEIKFQLNLLSHPRLDASGYMDLHLFPLLLLLLLVACCCCCFFSFVSLSLLFSYQLLLQWINQRQFTKTLKQSFVLFVHMQSCLWNYRTEPKNISYLAEHQHDQTGQPKYKIYWAEGSKHDGFSWATGIAWNGGDQRKFQTVISNKPKTLT